MPRRSHPSWLPVMAAGCVLGALALGWAGWRERARALSAQSVLRARTAERGIVASRSPNPNDVTVKSLREEIAAARQAASALADSLAGLSPTELDTAAPTKPVDAYFELAAYVQKNRALAAAARLPLQENERFGFAVYQSEGPAHEVLPAVAKQMSVLRHVLECLFESTPQALLAVQRELPLTPAQQAAKRAGGAARPAPTGAEAAAKDYFAIDPALSLFVPGETDTMAFRVEFVGRTPALRGFLNALAAFQLPLSVRSVEAEPLADAPATTQAAGAESNATLPVVMHSASKFAVVLELVELVRRPTDP